MYQDSTTQDHEQFEHFVVPSHNYDVMTISTPIVVYLGERAVNGLSRAVINLWRDSFMVGEVLKGGSLLSRRTCNHRVSYDYSARTYV